MNASYSKLAKKARGLRCDSIENHFCQRITLLGQCILSDGAFRFSQARTVQATVARTSLRQSQAWEISVILKERKCKCRCLFKMRGALKALCRAAAGRFQKASVVRDLWFPLLRAPP